MSVTEPRTRVEFPDEYCHLTSRDCPTLAGVGARQKKVVIKNIDVYALGMYVDKKAAKKVLGQKYHGKEPTELADSQLLCDEIVQSNEVPKSMLIVITSGMVNSDRFSNGIRETLGPALEKAGDSESFAEFEGMMKKAPFRKGMEMGFTSTPEGGLAARVEGEEVGNIKSPKFTRAFFGMFVGENPVSRDGKRNIQNGLAKIVTQE